MQTINETSEDINKSRQDAMIAIQDKVGDLVAELCDVKKEDIFSKDKTIPLPVCRGICWYAVRVAFDATYVEISKLTDLLGWHYTSAGVSFSVNQAVGFTIRSPHWSRVWNKVKAILPTDVLKDNANKDILIQIIIPKGSKDNIKFEIKEQQTK